MPTDLEINPIVQKVEQWLKEAASRGIHLKIGDHKLDDDWLYIVVLPAKKGIRAADHAQVMANIERQLRESGFDHVLLVPALED